MGGFYLERELGEQYVFTSFFILANKLQTAGNCLCGEITLKQYLVLLVIKTWAEGTPNMNDIAAAMGCTRQNIKNLIQALKKKGFITVKDSSSDKRATSITITKKGEEYLSERNNQRDEMLKDIFYDISDEEIQEFERLISSIYTNVDIMMVNNI